jgi:hypothetical protein
MNIIKIAAIIFLVLEAANVITLYFFPGSKYANGVGVFTAWEKSKSDPVLHNFIKYLVNWVAGSKLIFILLLIVILAMADEQSLIYVGIVMVISIASFYWRLFPLIRKMDRANEIEPKNYSAILGWMIFGFIILFLISTFIAIGT